MWLIVACLLNEQCDHHLIRGARDTIAVMAALLCARENKETLQLRIADFCHLAGCSNSLFNMDYEGLVHIHVLTVGRMKMLQGRLESLLILDDCCFTRYYLVEYCPITLDNSGSSILSRYPIITSLGRISLVHIRY